MTAKRKHRRSAGLPLFDLPLHSGTDDVEAAAGGTESTPPAAAQGPSVLYDSGESTVQGAQPELTEPGSPALDAAALDAAALDAVALEDSADDPSRLHDGSGNAKAGDRQLELTEPESSEATAPEHTALLGDRLLGGLADLAVQLLMLGLAVAASHALGVAVSPVDWMPFAVLALTFSFLYWAVPVAFWGHTPGMAWVGHTARGIDGEPLTFGQTFRRWLGAILTLALAGLPLLLSLTGRSFTDRLSGSRTVIEN